MKCMGTEFDCMQRLEIGMKLNRCITLKALKRANSFEWKRFHY